MSTPKIVTAIPRARYRLGEYQAVVLDEIESGDGVNYRYVLGLVREGESQPSAYVTCEKTPRARSREGAYRMRLVTEVFDEEIGLSDAWGEVEAFATEALTLAAQTLGLADETPTRIA